jgi:excisionase family DNA binding protein
MAISESAAVKKMPPVRETVDDAIRRAVREELSSSSFRQRRLLSIDEAAEYLGVSKGTIHNLIAEKKLTAARFTRWPMLDIEDLERLIQESKRAS